MTDSVSARRSPATANTPVALDIVGCGTVVQQVHVPVIKVLRDRTAVRIEGCYDRDPEQARRTAAMVGAERWAAEVGPDQDSEVEGALIATPPGSHAEIAGKYVRSSKGVFIEKPFTATAREASELVAESRARSVRIAVDHFWRFYPSVNVARSFLAPRLDQIDSIEAAEGFRWGWNPASDYVTEDRFGGVIHDSGAHLVDLVLYLLSLDVEDDETAIDATPVTKIPAREPSHECEGWLTLRPATAQEVAVRVTLSRLRPLARGVKVHGSFGTLFVPATFAFAPLLFDGSNGFRLRSAEPRPEPGDEFDCVLLIHLDFLHGLRDSGLSSRADGARFLRLSQVLESLHGGDGR
jgi:predicted dehydrogenase